eukprot:g5208.t1
MLDHKSSPTYNTNQLSSSDFSSTLPPLLIDETGGRIRVLEPVFETQEQVERKIPNKKFASRWTKEEDDVLREAVLRHIGNKNSTGVKWSIIATNLIGRRGKQCRERWHNHLDPTLKKGAWSLDEDTILLEKQKSLGNSWCKISKFLPGRSENSIKNRWNSKLKKRKRNLEFTVG